MIKHTLVFLMLSAPVLAQQPQEKHYTVDTSGTPREVKVGDKGSLSIVITPSAGKKVHDQAPLVVSLKGSKGVALAKNKLGHSDVANKGDKAPQIKAEFTAREPGEQTVDADMQFFICTDKWCERMTEKVKVTLNVVPADAAPAPTPAPK
ncbi:MAG: hypothetical protein AB2A00_26880 [Myxococcota bacterium]